MNGLEVYAYWAPKSPEPPETVDWTRWAKPVLFAAMGQVQRGERIDGAAGEEHLWAPPPSNTAFIVDLPGPASVTYGLLLARHGVRPVPLFNGCPGPDPFVSVEPIMSALVAGVEVLESAHIDRDAPPAFLLDSRRLGEAAKPKPGEFDNRWFVQPQDFPSANLLLSRGISEVVLIRDMPGRLQWDLAEVLLRWQEAGIRILSKQIQTSDAPEPLTVEKPPVLKAFWLRLMAGMGFRHNSAGGFGGVVPQASSGGGFG